MIRAIWNVLRGIVVLPFHKLISVFSRSTNRKDAVVQLQIQFTDGDAYIQNESELEEQNPKLLITAYLLFLSQFLYSCDERQIDPVTGTLRELIDDGGDPSLIVPQIMRSISETFNAVEKDAYEGIFGYPNQPPQYFFTGSAPTRPIAKYSLVTYRKREIWLIDLQISFRLNIVLFPLTAGLLYFYTCVEIGDDYISLFDSCLIEFLERLKSIDIRSRTEGARLSLANTIIAKHLGV